MRSMNDMVFRFLALVNTDRQDTESQLIDKLKAKHEVSTEF